jgi:hypothetical protein
VSHSFFIRTPITVNWRRRRVCVIQVFFKKFFHHLILVWYEMDNYSARWFASPNYVCSDTIRKRGFKIHFPFDTGGHQHVIPLTRVDAVYDNRKLDLMFVNAVMCWWLSVLNGRCVSRPCHFVSAICLIVCGARWMSYSFWKWRFSCSLSGHIIMSPQSCQLSSLEWFAYFKHVVQFLINVCLFSVHSWIIT